MSKPRSIFRDRRLRLAAERYLPQAIALFRSNRHLFYRGSITHLEVLHSDDCRRPYGEPCTCRPVVRLAGDPQAN